MSLLTFTQLFSTNTAAKIEDSDASLSLPAEQVPGLTLQRIKQVAARERTTVQNICNAAWAIVLSYHLDQSSVEFWSASPEHASQLQRVQVYGDSFLSDLLTGIIAGGSRGSTHLASSRLSALSVLDDGTHTSSICSEKLASGVDLHIRLSFLSHQPAVVQCSYLSSIPLPYIKSTIQHFLQILRNVAMAAEWTSLHVQDIGMLSLQEEMSIRTTESHPARSASDYEYGSIHQCFREQARKSPHAPAVEDLHHNIISYRDLDDMSDLMAEDLTSRFDASHHSSAPVMDNTVVVGIMLHRSPSIIIAILACWKAGLAIALLDPTHPRTRNEYIILDCSCSIVLVDDIKPYDSDLYKDRALAYDFSHLRSRAQTHHSDHETQLNLQENFDRVAWVKYTSGSTGTPKGAIQSHAALGLSLCAYESVPGTRVLPFLNPTFSAAGMPIWTYLMRGGCVCILPQSTMSPNLAGCIREFSIDDLCTTPGGLSLLTPGEVPSLITITLLSENVPRNVMSAWSPYVSIRLDYGTTEVNSHCFPLYQELGDGIGAPAIHLPQSDCSFYVLQPGSTRICPLYVPGEICVSSTYMCNGYMNKPELTSRAFVPHPYPGDAGHTKLYRTGDRGVLLGERRLVVLGRYDYQIKVDGNLVQPEEVEHALNQLSQVSRSRVIQVKPSTGPKILTACIKLQDTSINWQASIDIMRDHCEKELPAYMIPQSWMQVDKFPETATGKIDSGALTTQVHDILEKPSSDVKSGPQSFQQHLSTEGQLFLQLACEALTGISLSQLPEHVVSRMQNQSLIASGGSSLVTFRLLNSLRKHGLELSMSQLYGSASLLATAATLRKVRSRNDMEQSRASHTTFMGTALRLLPSKLDIDKSSIEAMYPATWMQTEMCMLSMLDRKQWPLYQYFDLSNIDCTTTQLEEAISLLTEAKPILRTLFLPLHVAKCPTSPADALQMFDLTRQDNFVQVVMKPGSVNVAVLQDEESKTPREQYRKDYIKGWHLNKPWWRATFMTGPRLLALVVHHSLSDEGSFQHISRDLNSILRSILRRDCGEAGGLQALQISLTTAKRPSMQQWAEQVYGSKGLIPGHLPDNVAKHVAAWRDFTAGVLPTHIPDETLHSMDEEPRPTQVCLLEDLPYMAFCRQHNITAAALFQAVLALAMAKVLKDEHTEEQQHVPNKITFYRVCSNRFASGDATDVEGSLYSITPAMVSLEAGSDVVSAARDAMSHWLATRESDPYFVEEGLINTGPGQYDKQRSWSNMLFNHIVPEEAPSNEEYEPLRDVIEDQGFFAPCYTFTAIEVFFIEVDPKKGDALRLGVFSALSYEVTARWLRLVERVLRLILEKGGGIVVRDILEQLTSE